MLDVIFGGGRRFEKGGIVPGPIGSPVPILAHGGERVIPTGGGDGVPIQLESHIYLDGRQIARVVSEHLGHASRRRGG